MTVSHAASPSRDAAPGFALREIPPARAVADLATDVARGFASEPAVLPPKYFYDERGSELFDRICDTPEYYPTRTEQALLDAHADEIVAATRPANIVELGAGTARKTQALLAACDRAGRTPVYWPFDVCREVIEAAAGRLCERFPWLRVEGLVGDYTAGLDHLPHPQSPCLYVFLGGTLGNFEPAEGQALLAEIAARMGDDDRLLLGTDRVKDRAVLEAAYDDAAGVTAAFNANVLQVINRELDADFDPAQFRHRAPFNESEARIEMLLEARREQLVTIGALDARYRFAPGSAIRTEISRKFTPDSLAAELAGGGLVSERELLADHDYFSLTLARRA